MRIDRQGMNRQDAKDAKKEDRVEPSAELDRMVHRVIGAAIEVHRLLGPGFLESVYEEALCIELCLQGIPFARQVTIGIEYKGKVVGQARMDLVVADQLRLGLLITFNVAVLRTGIKRVIHTT